MLALVVDYRSIEMKLFAKVLAFVAICSASFSVLAISDAQRDAIAERLKPVGSVCVQGDSSCANASVAAAGGGAKSGEEIYNSNCMACHSTGAAGAPKFDDKAEWSSRLAARSVETIYEHAINGYNGMPAKGLCMSCSEDEIKSTVDYILAHNGL
jgi:cytochrome c5